jgi:hypothetical protein
MQDRLRMIYVSIILILLIYCCTIVRHLPLGYAIFDAFRNNAAETDPGALDSRGDPFFRQVHGPLWK